MKLGRPTDPGKSKLDPYRPEIESLLANVSTQKFIARRYHTTEANLHHWLRKHGLKRPKRRCVRRRRVRVEYRDFSPSLSQYSVNKL
jgi:hypothetical protein